MVASAIMIFYWVIIDIIKPVCREIKHYQRSDYVTAQGAGVMFANPGSNTLAVVDMPALQFYSFVVVERFQTYRAHIAVPDYL